MAKAPKATTGEEQATAPRQSLADVHGALQAEKDAQLERILESAPTAAPAAKEPPEVAEPEGYTPEKYQETWEKLPEQFRAEYAQNVIAYRDNQIAQEFGPEVVAVLKEVKSDPKLAKIFKSLTAKEKRDWLADTALEIYEDPRFAAPAADGESVPDPKVAELESKIEGLEKARKDDEQRAWSQNYGKERQDEYQAFLEKFPTLRYDAGKVRFSADGTEILPAVGVSKDDADYKKARKVYAIIERAEEQTRKQNYARKISYADVGIEMMDMWDAQEKNPAPVPVPNVSTKDVPKPQAPRTRVEARSAIAQAVQKHGNISNLARALRS